MFYLTEDISAGDVSSFFSSEATIGAKTMYDFLILEIIR
jgi:hypothetical protein